MDSECEAKLRDMQKYVPCLDKLIEKLKEENKASKLSQMQLLYKLLTKSESGVTIQMLTKCEEVLEKVFGSSQQSGNSSPQSEENSLPSGSVKNLNCLSVSDEGDNTAITENIQDNSASDNKTENLQLTDLLDDPLIQSNDVIDNKVEEPSEVQGSEEETQKSLSQTNGDECIDEEAYKSEGEVHSDNKSNPDENGADNKELLETVSEIADNRELATSKIVNETVKRDNESDVKFEKMAEETVKDDDEFDVESKKIVDEAVKDECESDAEPNKITDDETKKDGESDVEDEEHQVDKDENERNESEEESEKESFVDNKTDSDMEGEDFDHLTDVDFDKDDNYITEDEIRKLEDESQRKDKEQREGNIKSELENKSDNHSKNSCTVNEETVRMKFEDQDQERNELKENSLERESIDQKELKIRGDKSCEDIFNKEINDFKKEPFIKKKGLEEPLESITNEKNEQTESDENDENVIKNCNNKNMRNKKGSLLTKNSESSIKESKEKGDAEFTDLSNEEPKEEEESDNLLIEMKKCSPKNKIPLESISMQLRKKAKSNKNNKTLQIHNKSSIVNITNIKTIELKPEDPTEKPDIVYLVKKGAPKPMEIITLLDSDSEDDDVIIVSESGLKKKPTVPKPILQKKAANTSKLQLTQSSSSSFQPGKSSQPMFAITSVKSISPQKPSTTGLVKASPVKGTPLRQTKPQATTVPRSNFTNQLTQKVLTFQGSALKGTSSPQKKSKSQVKSTSTKTPKISPKKVNKDNAMDGISSVLDDSITDGASRYSLDAEANAIRLMVNRDDSKTVDWTRNYLSNMLSPSQYVTQYGMELLQKSLDAKTFNSVKLIIEENKEIFGATSVKEITNSGIATQHADIMSLFIANGSLTDIGVKLVTISRQNTNRVYTTDRRTGNPSSRSRNRPKELQDDEYAPSVNVEFGQETVADRRKSLRREGKTNRKQYFAYEDDDDAEFLELLEEHARIEASIAKKKKLSAKRSNGSIRSEAEVKKMRLQEGFSVDTPFETDLLKPTWVEEGPSKPYIFEQFAEEEIEEELANEEMEQIEYDQEQEEQHPDFEQYVEPNEDNRMLIDLDKPFKNVNRAHHCRSRFIDACVLCNVKHNFVVAHYVNQHRDSEVVISRLTQRDTDQLVKNINCGYLMATRSTAYNYSATCVFCKREMTFALRYWWEHYTMHTGEYGYECSKCFLRRPRRQHAQKHANGECKFGLAQVKVNYPFDKTINSISAHICKLCNYIQLHKENVVKHLKTQHEMKQDISSQIISTVLLQISKPYPENIQGGESQSNSNADLDNSNSEQCELGENSYQSYDFSDEAQTNFMQYSGDDLSFMICGMLATDDATESELQTSENFKDVSDQLAAKLANNSGNSE